MSSVSMGKLAEDGAGLSISCFAPGCRPKQMLRNWHGRSLTGVEAAERWGADLTLADVMARWRCPICGHRGKHIFAEPTGYGPGGTARGAIRSGPDLGPQESWLKHDHIR